MVYLLQSKNEPEGVSKSGSGFSSIQKAFQIYIYNTGINKERVEKFF